jgi:acetyl-CoA carboxylase carboxyltransferase component
MFLTGPEVVRSVTGEDVTQEALGGAMTHAVRSGVAHAAFDNDLEALAAVRELVTMLPGSNREDPPRSAMALDPPNRESPVLDRIVPPSEVEVRLKVHSVSRLMSIES